MSILLKRSVIMARIADDEIARLAQEAIDDRDRLRQLVAGIAPGRKSAAERERCSRALRLIGETRPEALADQWDAFAALLKSGNAFSQYPAVEALASLAGADRERRFDALMDDYFGLLENAPVSIAAHVALSAARIARARPDLLEGIVGRLLAAEASGLEEGRRDLVKAYALESLEALYDSSERKAAIVAFAAGLRGSRSPKARKAADLFLKKHEP